MNHFSFFRSKLPLAQTKCAQLWTKCLYCSIHSVTSNIHFLFQKYFGYLNMFSLWAHLQSQALWVCWIIICKIAVTFTDQLIACMLLHLLFLLLTAIPLRDPYFNVRYLYSSKLPCSTVNMLQYCYISLSQKLVNAFNAWFCVTEAAFKALSVTLDRWMEIISMPRTHLI